MILWSRWCIWLSQILDVPGWAQVLVQFVVATSGVASATDLCLHLELPAGVRWLLFWLLNPVLGEGQRPESCPLVSSDFGWYVMFYTAAFHYCRPVFTRLRSASAGRCDAPCWAVLALGASTVIGTTMAAFHYPSIALEYGIADLRFRWYYLPLELSASLVQPLLFALSMTWFPYDVKWWGNTTFGTYVFHFYFTWPMCAKWMPDVMRSVHNDPFASLLQLGFAIGIPLLFSTFAGPIGHHLLLCPHMIYRRVRSWNDSRSSPRHLPTGRLRPRPTACG